MKFKSAEGKIVDVRAVRSILNASIKAIHMNAKREAQRGYTPDPRFTGTRGRNLHRKWIKQLVRRVKNSGLVICNK